MTDSFAKGEAGVVGGEGTADLEARLARAEERLAFYASFDRLIQDNVSQAGQLMRDALELRERTQAELEEARAAAEARVTAERGRYRDDLAAVHAELVGLQATTATLARRVAATLGAMAGAEGPPGASTGAVGPGAGLIAAGDAPASAAAIEPGESEAAVEAGAAEAGAAEAAGVPASPIGTAGDPGSGGDAGDIAVAPPVADGAVVGDADEAEAVEELTTAGGDEPATAGADSRGVGVGGDEATSADDAAMTALGTGPRDAAVAAEERSPVAGSGEREVGGPGEGAAPFPVADDVAAPAVVAGTDRDDRVASGAAAAPAAARSVMVLVHGVPRAAAALSLQRHLHGLRHVESVEAREYAEGVLRLQVMTGETLGLDDLRGWEAGGEMEPVTVTADVIEVRLPGAHGF